MLSKLPRVAQGLTLLSLPTELVVNILDELPIRDLICCTQTCKCISKLIKDTVAFQYKVELYASKHLDVPQNKLSKATKLNILKRYRKIWKTFPTESFKCEDIPLMEGPLWELAGGVLAQSKGRRILELHRFESTLRRIPKKMWSIEVDFDIADFSMDVAQDLLVAVEALETSCRVHLLTISTGEKHPLASSDVLNAGAPRVDIHERSYNIRVSGEYCGILARMFDQAAERYRDSFTLRNWRTGAEICALSGTDIISFTFLDNKHVALARGFAVEYTVPITGAITVLNFTKVEDLSQDWQLWNLEVLCDPAPAWVQSSREEAPPPFRINGDDRVAIIRINAISPNIDDSYDFFIRPSSLISFVPDKFAKSAKFISWQKWGPKSRILQGPPASYVWCYPSFGSMFASKDDHTGKVVLYDFSPVSIRRAKILGTEENETLVTSVVPTRPRMFNELIISGLPYCKILTDLEAKGSLMLSEDSIIMVEEDKTNFHVLSL
ncbi:hypothetical protein ABKN59_003052 [Abortiporus biennis]